MFKLWSGTKSSATPLPPSAAAASAVVAAAPVAPTLTSDREPSSTLTTSLLTLVAESKKQAFSSSSSSSSSSAETKLGLNSWSLRGKEKATKVTGLPVITPVTVSPIQPSITNSVATEPSYSSPSSSANTPLSAAGHLAGIVAAATVKPLVGKAASNNGFLAPKFIGTARRFGLNTVVNMARFAANLHQFSTNLRIIGPKDRKRINREETNIDTESVTDKEAGLGSEDSGIGEITNNTNANNNGCNDDNSSCNGNCTVTVANISNGLSVNNGTTKPSSLSLSSLSLSLSQVDDDKLGKCHDSVTTPTSPTKEEVDQAFNAFLSVSSLTTLTDDTLEEESNPVMQLANVMETAFSYAINQDEVNSPNENDEKMITSTVSTSTSTSPSTVQAEDSNIDQDRMMATTVTTTTTTLQEVTPVVTETLIVHDQIRSTMTSDSVDITACETANQVGSTTTASLVKEDEEPLSEIIPDKVERLLTTTTTIMESSPTATVASEESIDEVSHPISSTSALDDNNNDNDNSTESSCTDQASSSAMQSAAIDTVPSTTETVKSSKKSRWFSKVGGKFSQKQDKSAKATKTKTTSSTSVSSVISNISVNSISSTCSDIVTTESSPQLVKEKTLRKSICRRFRSVGRRDHVEPANNSVYALDGSQSSSVSMNSTHSNSGKVITSSPSSSDDENENNSNTSRKESKKSRCNSKSLEVPRTRRWTLDFSAAIRRHHSDSFVASSDLASEAKTDETKRVSSSSSSSGGPPPLLRIDTTVANHQDADEKESDQISSASSSSSSLPVTPTTPSYGPNDMHCPSRRVAYLGSVRKLQDCRRPLREVIGVQSVLAEVRRLGGVRVPVREVHAALAAGDRDLSRRRRRLSAQQLARRQAIAVAEGKPMPLNGMRLESDVTAGTSMFSGSNRRPSSWPHSQARLALRRSASLPLMTPLISFDTDPVKSPSSSLKMEIPAITGQLLTKGTQDYEEDDVPLALLCESSSRRANITVNTTTTTTTTRPMVVAS